MSDNGSTGTADGGGDVNGDDEAARALRELAEASGRAMLFGGAPSPAGSALFPSLAGTALDDNGTEGQAPGAGPPLIGAVVPPEWQQNPSEALPNLCGHLKELLCAVVGACGVAGAGAVKNGMFPRSAGSGVGSLTAVPPSRWSCKCGC